MTFAYTIALTMLVALANVLASATPEASPVANDDCADLPAYFQNLADLTGSNSGYIAIKSDAATVFDLPADVSQTISTSLEELIRQLDSMEPPVAAEDYHEAFVDQVAWYRDLVSAVDFAAYQRIVNRDKQLVPAMSRAILAGQAACGVDTWADAYNDAFGEKP